MPPPRILTVYPRLVRPLPVESVSRSFPLQRQPKRRLHVSRAHAEQVNQRYGTANEPPPHLGGSAKSPSAGEKALPPPEEADPDQKLDGRDHQSEQKQSEAHDGEASATESTPPTETTQATSESNTASEELSNQPPSAMDATSALSSILSMKPPMSDDAASSHPPHLQTPPYVHHFDTHSFVRALQSENAFTEAQSVTLMKAIRSMLADNIVLAREGIVSRGDAEMDAYQFRAASGELRTEMRQRRVAADDKYRAERMLIQHEVDSLAQRITQESLNLKDELKGMFDDRKMAVRMERRNTDNRIHELGYKITTAMNSGMRNEIEGLRFILTRRTVLALTAVVVMSLMALRLATYSSKKEEQKEKQKQKGDAGAGSGPSADGERTSHPGDRYGSEAVPGEMSSDEIARRVQRGENPALASLG